MPYKHQLGTRYGPRARCFCGYQSLSQPLVYHTRPRYWYNWRKTWCWTRRRLTRQSASCSTYAKRTCCPRQRPTESLYRFDRSGKLFPSWGRHISSTSLRDRNQRSLCLELHTLGCCLSWTHGCPWLSQNWLELFHQSQRAVLYSIWWHA